MKKLLTIQTATALAVACTALFSGAATTNQTYTVTVLTWKHTNVIEVIRDHEKKIPPCTLIRYVEGGRTNDFHAWAVKVVVETNKVSRR